MRTIPQQRLSKVRFTAGLQCFKRLYLMVNAPDEAAGISDAGQLIRDRDREVGELATRLFKAGVPVDQDHQSVRKAIERTQELISDTSVPAIFEAAFTHNNVHVRVDILERLPRNRWHLLGVTSATGVKGHHVPDLAIQQHVLEKCGLKVARISLMHLNRAYVYDGTAYRPEKLFTISNVQDSRKPLMLRIYMLINLMRMTLSQDHPPIVAPGNQCTEPFECAFYHLCNPERQADWIGNLYKLSAKKFIDLQLSHIDSIKDIPEDFELSAMQQRIRTCLKKNKPYFSAGLKAQLAELKAPVCFMDFETVNPALPRHAGMRPYDQLPFQWSVHVLNRYGAKPRHYEFLHDGTGDPRKDFIETLLEVLEQHCSAPIVVYNQSFEAGRLSELAALFPKYAARIKRVHKRLWDLLPVVRKNVYHPQFCGSFSIKRVLPALVPGMSYAGMGVEDGAQAGAAYMRMLAMDAPLREKKRLRKDLLQYCAQDTLAMVKIVEVLRSTTVVQDG